MAKFGSVKTRDGEVVSGKIVSDGPSLGTAIAGALIGTAIAGPVGGVILGGAAASVDERTVETADGTRVRGKRF
ncbi:MAG: hypothetical protein H6883_02595 [Rhodobiaceae bacterium]|nr:hypothetical protein [Rhodobiaceae bacterium]MCC0055007.1 hypothetical protein [Rhodobiaceae bacterium]